MRFFRNLCRQRTDFTSKVYILFKKKASISKKNVVNVCQYQKMLYLCIAFEKDI